MTKNQIDYWTLQESKRHNVTTENETNRHNVVTEGETERHNRATESRDLGALNESIRHNQATEAIELGKLQETSRHNVVSEGQNQSALTETSRHNQATEANANKQIQLGYSQLSEQKRHNVASEQLQGQDLNIKAGQLTETSRHNVEMEEYNALQNQYQQELAEARALLAQYEAGYYPELTNAQINKLRADIDNANAQAALARETANYLPFKTAMDGLVGTLRALNGRGGNYGR